MNFDYRLDAKQRKNVPDAIFTGFRLDPAGNRVETWADPNVIREEGQANKRLEAFAGLAGAAGIADRNLGKLVDAYGKLIQSFEKNESSTRRSFLLATATAMSAGVIGCGDSGVTDIDKDQLNPIISGPAEVSIPWVGSGASIELDGSQSGGPITEVEWRQALMGTEIEPVRVLGDQLRQTYEASRPGEHIFHLTLKNGNTYASASHTVNVKPPQLPGGGYESLPALYAVLEPSSDPSGKTPAIYTINPNEQNAERHRLFGSNRIDTNKFTWQPGGERIAFSMLIDALNANSQTRITTYNMRTGEFNAVSYYPVPGKAWRPSFSPDAEWIGFIDDARAPFHGYDEAAIVRPDGTGQFYLAGEETNDTYVGLTLSWNETSERLGMGNMRFPDLTDTTDRRIGIVEDLWSPNPARELYIPSNDQLERFWGEHGTHVSRQELLGTGIGGNGVAWSPDGKRMVYDIIFGYTGDDVRHFLVMSNVDCTGDITVLAEARGEDWTKSMMLPVDPTWSPDGKEILFSAMSNFQQAIYRIPVDPLGSIQPCVGPGRTVSWYG